ncbi:hypothetical protein HDV06_005976 [Boothiomyces sp. JEL0866]|nr:hypothetical protein HDV06_005976 [Boothiomyces sp. JEL0866]
MYSPNHWFLFFEVFSAGFLFVEIVSRISARTFNSFEKVNILSGIACVLCSLFDNIVYRPDYVGFTPTVDVSLLMATSVIMTVSRCVYLHYTASRCLSMSDYKSKTKYVSALLVFITGSMQLLGGITFCIYYVKATLPDGPAGDSDLYAAISNWIYLFNEFIEKPAIFALEVLFFSTFWEKMKSNSMYSGMEEEANSTLTWNAILLIGIVIQLLSCVMAVYGYDDISAAMNWYQFNTNVTTFVNLRFRSIAVRIMGIKKPSVTSKGHAALKSETGSTQGSRKDTSQQKKL